MESRSTEYVDINKYEHSAFEAGRSRVVKAIIERYRAAGQALDLGSGPGWFTKVLIENGWIVTAIDGEPAHEGQLKQLNANVLIGDAREILTGMDPGQFNMILALEIVEHMDVSSAKLFLRNLKELLAPEGVLLVSTPNRMSPIGLKDYYIREVLLRGERWTAWHPNHIHVYNSWELKGVLKECGYTVERLTGYWYDFTSFFKTPFSSSSVFPVNHFGFNITLECRV
ncbi:MAG: class I SAM-dependent methyltransferase [Syntrophales bacterium]